MTKEKYMVDIGIGEEEEDKDEIDHQAISRVSLRQSLRCRSKSIDERFQSSETTAAEANVLLKSAPFYKFVLTGGPCGGKTTALARLSSYLRDRGFEVISVPEAFTILSSNGFGMEYFSVEGMPFCVQNTVMDMQMSLEDSFERVLRARGKPGVLLCDRGLCDGAAYMSPTEWDTVLDRRGVTAAEIRDGRYNAIFHLVTAAEGAEPFYTLDNNDARTETPDQARVLDKLTRAAWVGHPKLFVIDNTTDFERKMNKLIAISSELVGLPSTNKSRTVKYLLRDIPNVNAFPPEEDIEFNLFEVEKVYLYDIDKKDGENENYSEEYSFIRKRTHLSVDGNGRQLGSSYGLTTVQITHSGKQVEVKRIITAREYMTAFKNRDINRHVIRQKRITFIWNMQSFTIHAYKEPAKVENLALLHVQTSNDGRELGETDGVKLPVFLNVERKLVNSQQDKKKFGAFSISLLD